MTTPAEQEAERRYPKTARMRFAFESGAAFEREQLRELLEAAREYRDGMREYEVAWEELQGHFTDPAYATAIQNAYWKHESGKVRLLAAAAALEEATDE